MQYVKATAPPLNTNDTELVSVPALSVVDISENDIIDCDQVRLLDGESVSSSNGNNCRTQRKINLLNHKGNIVQRSATKAAEAEAEAIKKAQSSGWKLTMEEEIGVKLAKRGAYYASQDEANGILRQQGSNTSTEVNRTLIPEDVARPLHTIYDNGPIPTDPNLTSGSSEPVPLGLTYGSTGYKSIYDDPSYATSTYNVSEGMSYGGEYKIPEYKSIYDQKDGKK